MKLRTILPVAAVGLGIIATASTQACSSSSSGSTSGTSADSLQPPAKPSAGAPGDTTTARTFALSGLFLGGFKRDGSPNSDAWKDYGYDLDGKNTTAKSTDVCTQQMGAMKAEQVDGTKGTDNSFGENILGFITGVDMNAEADVNKSITDGSFTVMLNITGLTDDPAQTNTGLGGQIFAGGAYSTDMSKPTFDKTTDWPVSPELLADGMTIAGGSKIKLPTDNTYIVNGEFVSQASKITLALSIGGYSIAIDINKAIITFNHTQPGVADNGIIAGIIDTEQLISQLKLVAGRLSSSLCDGAAFETIAQQIRGASDIMSDGTNGPGQMCSGISIGIGFKAAEIKNPDKVAPTSPPGADPCTSGGTDAGTDSGNQGGQDSGNQGTQDASDQ